MREPCCSVGYGGDYEICAHGLESGCKRPWHISWLPKGYGPTRDDFIICLVAVPPGDDWSRYGLAKGKRPPIIEAICVAIEDQMRAHYSHPGRTQSRLTPTL